MIRRRHPGSGRRWLRLGAIGLGGVLVAAVAAVAGLIWATLPGGSLEAGIPGLQAPVAISIDADGIPRIRAASEHDAAAALGFLHARERFFQMDMTRRAAAGELSELAGPLALPVDRMMRTLGVRHAAEADLAALPAETRDELEAYTAGVNAWLARRGRLTAAEYLVLGAPRPWAAVDCLLWAKAMGLYLSGNWRTELSRAALANRLDPAAIRALWPAAGGPGHPEASLTPALSVPAARLANVSGLAERLAGLLPRFPAPFTIPETASDEWAVDGAHSATGAPLLAGDPHLGFSLPGIWYLARIDLPGRALVGATAPGVPFLLIGQNGHIAWTFTNTGADVQDLFIETPAGPDSYATPDGPRKFTVRRETIHVRGAPDEVMTVRETRHGPVVSDLTGPNGPILAASLANLMPGDRAAAGMQQLNRATTLAEAQAAAPNITAPVQNLLVADKTGIALFVTGRIPIRKSGDGALPANGADGASDWTGWASGDALPHIINPASGRLANGNERIAPPDFPVFLGADWFADNRARRIRQLLDTHPRPDVADFADMQADAVSLFARDHLAQFLAAPADGLAAQARDLLRGWDGTMRRDAPQPLIFQAWTEAAGRRLIAQLGATPGAAAPIEDLLSHALSPDGADWCPPGCAPLLSASLAEATADLAKAYGDNPAAWRWGTAHKASFPHPLLRFVPVLAGLAGAAIESDGGNDTLFRAGSYGRNFAGVHGPSYRGVYDLAAPDRSRFVVAPGQSGHFASSLARNFLARWQNGATVTIGPTPETTDVTIIVRPAP